MSGKHKSKNDWKKEIKEEQNYKCAQCGETFGARQLQIHHKKNKCRGGTNARENCCAVCENCHKWIHETYGNNYYDPRK
jgi:5-methylcytosine-specific restriction endonuclease McrA